MECSLWAGTGSLSPYTVSVMQTPSFPVPGLKLGLGATGTPPRVPAMDAPGQGVRTQVCETPRGTGRALAPPGSCGLQDPASHLDSGHPAQPQPAQRAPESYLVVCLDFFTSKWI